MAADQIVIQTLVAALKTELENLTWQPAGNASTTSFIEVNTFPKFSGAIGSPWANVLDEEPDIIKKAMGGLVYEKRVPIAVYICTDFAEIGEEEATIRMRYAYEATETLLTTKATMDNINAPGYSYNGWTDVPLQEQPTVYIRRLELEVQAKI